MIWEVKYCTIAVKGLRENPAMLTYRRLGGPVQAPVLYIECLSQDCTNS